MASYMYNPSKKVTDILSKFFDFDPSELELGIWSGDLQLKNVKLRQEAIHPLLNRKANKPHVNPLKKAPLHMKLVSGTVGNMRMRIPWKRLVWGQGDVRIEISDIMIVITLQSREETEEQRQHGLLKERKKKDKDNEEGTRVSSAYREAKQRRLREAERRHLQGMPLALYLEGLHRKNSIAREAAKIEAATKSEGKTDQSTVTKKPGKLDTWLKKVGSDMFWRFFAGIQGSITKARIVVVQDGVEMGCVIQSIEIIAGKDGTHVNVNMDDDPSDLSDEARTAAEMTPPEGVVYESAYEDGEHVDKNIKQQGLGVFIRKEINMAKVPQSLRFSTSVSADDYILRPVDLDLAFSFFYPFPPERRKKRAIDNRSQSTPTTTASTISAPSVDESISATSAHRRGKRDKDRVAPKTVSGTSSQGYKTPSRAAMMNTMQKNRGTVTPFSGHDSRLRNQQRRLFSEQGSLTASQQKSFRSLRSGGNTVRTGPLDHQSVALESTSSDRQDPNLDVVPKLDCRMTLKDIRVVLSTRHYELLNYFFSTISRMKNGRPDQMIRSTPKETNTEAFKRKFMDMTPETMLPKKETDDEASKKQSLLFRARNANALRAMIAPITGLVAGFDDVDIDHSSASLDQEDQRLTHGRRSIRAQAVHKWWKYSIGAILWEIKKRKHLATNFRQMYISFDWRRQNYKRKEYIELYISKKLNERKDVVWPFEDSDKREAELLVLEDELPIEQILLYRSIARSIRVRGMTQMPKSILELHTTQTLKVRDRQKRRSTNVGPSVNKEEAVGDDTILSLVLQNFKAASGLREPGGLKKKFRSKDVELRKQSITLDDIESDADVVETRSDVWSSGDAVRPMLSRRKSFDTSGYDSSSYPDHDPIAPSQRLTPRNPQRRGSLGNDNSNIQTGNFYQSASTRRDTDARTIRTFQKKDANSTRMADGGKDGTSSKRDDRMKISCSFSVKTIDLMIVEEECVFDFSPDQLKNLDARKQSSIVSFSRDDYSGEDESSSDNVSDISVMTDDQRFFNETGQAERVTEEEEEEAAAKMYSTDFLHFGLPENPLLRLTVNSFGCSVRGRSGGRLDFGVSVRRIAAESENKAHIFSMGMDEEIAPISEVQLGQTAQGRAKSFDSFDMNLSGPLFTRQDSNSVSVKTRGPQRALSMMLRADESCKDIQCDLSEISLTVDLAPASKLLQFYSKTEIKFPDRVVEKSSRDVARKFMVYKTSSKQRFSGTLSAALHIQGIEIRVPFNVGTAATAEEASNVEAFDKDDDGNLLPSNEILPRSALVFSINSLDFHRGSYVDNIVAVAQMNDRGVSTASQLSGSIVTARAATVGKSLEMIDIIALTAANDSFSCKHIVATITGINCLFETSSGIHVRVIDTPIAMESIMTINEVSLLDTELPKTQIVVELSPLDVVLSKDRLEMISCVQSSLNFNALDTTSSSAILKKIRKPDPPRIEILARKILNSVVLNCSRVQLSLIKDLDDESQTISPKMKETILEECLCDFLSVLSCYELTFPNEEALSSAMQVCISRLVGLGLSNDDAWGCTNAARLNFLDDIAFMRRTQSEALEQLSTSIGRDPSTMRQALQKQTDVIKDDSSSTRTSEDEEDSINISLSDTGTTEVLGYSIEIADPDDPSEDDDSAQSVEIVETTLQNAVEKTLAAFAPLLHTYRQDFKELSLNTIVTLELPLGFRMSAMKLFYDSHLAVLVTSLVIMNSAGIELLTLVPPGEEEQMTQDSDLQTNPSHGLAFSRYDHDHDYLFGEGGLPMSALAAEDDEAAIITRKRSRLDDIEIGEMEILFSSKIAEGILDEIAKFRAEEKASDEHTREQSRRPEKKYPDSFCTSVVLTAGSVSALFTNDELVPFSRMTLERVAYRNSKALERSLGGELPSWLVVADNACLHNLTPAGQFYPDTLSLISPPSANEDLEDFPFQIHYFTSPDPWKLSSRLTIDFEGFRLFLIRQFIHELLQFFVYDRDGIGRLKKKYGKDVRDRFGNQRPPLLWSVRIRDTSVVCPRSSTDSDMAAFEVGKAYIAVSYIPMSFEMPSESSPFCPAPQVTSPTSNRFSDMRTRNSFLSIASDEYHECIEEPENERDEFPTEPISAFSKDLKRRITIDLHGVRVFTVVAPDSTTRDAVESPLFRFFYTIDGRAADGKLVYHQGRNIENVSYGEVEALKQVGRIEQRWEEISTQLLDVEVFADYAPHMRLFIGSRMKAFTVDARMSQLCLLLSVWDNNMQEQPTMFPFPIQQVSESATPPKVPKDFPEYGTAEYVAHLEDTSSVRSEICCIFKELSLRCTYDPPGHFSADPGCFKYIEDPACPDDEKPGVVLALEDANIHVLNDFLNVRRIAIGASFLEIVDERRHQIFQKVLSTTRVGTNESPPRAWADLAWGLRNDHTTMNSSLPIPVIFTVFMTPGWSLINVGGQSLNGIMHDLSWIWVFLDYFKSYYTQVAFGNLGHQAQRWVHKIKNAIRKSKGEQPKKFEPLPGVNVDFRLWLCRPILTVPSEYFTSHAPSLRIDSRTGLWYRYKSIKDLSSQEVATTDLNLHYSNEFQAPGTFRDTDLTDNPGGSRSLVEGLSFGLRYDCNNLCNHKDVSLIIPFAGEDIPDLSVAGKELEVTPLILPPPIVCRPDKPLSRRLGTQVCEITSIIEVLPTTSATMMNFFKGPTDLNEDFLEPEEDKGPVTFSVSAELHDLRVFAIDPVLGVQLPVAVVSISSLELCTTKFNGGVSEGKLLPGESPADDMQLALRSHLWVDYFKLGMTRSWEPLIEPFEFLLMQETARERGQGISLEADSPLHVNLSGAFLQILGETVESFSSVVKDTFGEKGTNDRGLRRRPSLDSRSRDRVGARIEDSIRTHDAIDLQVLHEIPKPLKSKDRVAFSMRNLTGEKIRVHQQTDRTTESALTRPAVVTYLNHAETMGLTFSATISIIKNLNVVEVPYPGLPDSPATELKQGSLTHAVDLQLPGFRWIQAIKVDTFGRRFEPLVPRSRDLLAKMSRDWRLRNALMVLTEVGFDSGGRLVTVRSLFEVTNHTSHPIKLVFHPDPRGRPTENPLEEHRFDQVDETVTAADPPVVSQHMIKNCEEIQVIQPGGTFHLPTLLLQRSLQMTGSHLGCLWLCPDTSDKSMAFWNFFRATTTSVEDDVEVSFSSRPIQLAKLVHESSIIFQNGTGMDIAADDAKSGVQVSCPTRSRKGGGRAPFCYAIEVGRSPLINSNREGSEQDLEEGVQGEPKTSQKKRTTLDRKTSKKVTEHIHGPVVYSLSIHAPLVIVNLLPQGGRFELMHAVRKTVVWYADLKPGQQIPIHSVGLDAPLLLLVNLGFCRTPVGEGALVHHGTDSVAVKKGEQGPSLKAIGIAALKGTKQIGKTLTAISDSPDRRGQGRLAKINARQSNARENRKSKKLGANTANPGYHDSLGLEHETGDFDVTTGKVHSVDAAAFSQDEIATETTVVDGIGQRLTLNLENIRGGGGERRVSLFCRFWIVNTTEHSLRYKQEKAKTFVSGTVHGPERDGSRPVDGSNRNHRELPNKANVRRVPSKLNVVFTKPDDSSTAMNARTVFSGTPGALATTPGYCGLPAHEITELIDRNLPLESVSHLAFMFNFHEEGLSIGHQMLSVQLYDGSGSWNYTSEWSRGFSLDSVGFSQIVAMNTKEGRAVELLAEVNVAPGFMSSYTKIVRFVPRYLVFNRLERPVRIWQDSSVFRPVDQEQMAGFEASEINDETRKWRYHNEEKHSEGRINQYECLYGRPSTIEPTGNEPSNSIPEGTTAHRSALYIKTVVPDELTPILLPDTTAERQLRVDLGGIWNISPSFSSDLPGEHILKVSRATDLRMLRHVSTRAAPRYNIVLPPPESSRIVEWDGELGVFFETEWGTDRRIIVKGTKRGHFAFNHTDIHVGDELLRIDGVSVTKMSFAEAMSTIKERISLIRYETEQRKKEAPESARRHGMLRRIGHRRKLTAATTQEGQSIQLVLTFSTLEERLRRLRAKAARSRVSPRNRFGDRDSGTSNADKRRELSNDVQTFKVETKSLHNTMFIILRKPEEENPPFRVQNRSINHIVFFRQRGCQGHPWNVLLPGESVPYAWEEPMRPKKLSVRLAAKPQNAIPGTDDYSSNVESDGDPDLVHDELASPEQEKASARVARIRQALAYQYVNNEERGGYGPATSVRLEEIGFRTFLPVPSNESGRNSNRRRNFLNCEVDTDGGTRLLIISDDAGSGDDRSVLCTHLETLKKQISYEEQRIAGLNSLQFLLSKETTEDPEVCNDDNAERVDIIENDAKRFVDDFPEENTISSRHQVVVEVIEAVGLHASDFVGTCNPYCEIFLKGRSRSRQYFFQKRRNMRKTYFIEKSLNPQWTDQKFVFDVPEEAVSVTRGHHLLIKLRNFRLVGQHPILGQASVHLGSLRDQRELLGWYPLAGRTGRSDVEFAHISDVGRGSIKLRVQWIYTRVALIDYFLMLSHARLCQLTKSHDGMTEQLSHAIDSDERRREAKKSVNAAGRITNLAKLQKRTEKKRQPSSRHLERMIDGKSENMIGKMNRINSSLNVLKGTLKSSRDRYLQALYFQTAESKRKRQLEESGQNLPNQEGAFPEEPDDLASDPKNSSVGQSPSSHRALQQSPSEGESSRNKQSLDEFFAISKSTYSRSPFLPGSAMLRPESGDSPRRRSRHNSLDAESVQRHFSHRKLSLDAADQLGEDGTVDHEHWRSGLSGASDLISVGSWVDEEATRKRNTQILKILGLVFHEHGVYFHRNHLPHHFRRSLFGDRFNGDNVHRLYRPKFAVLSNPHEVVTFKSAQAAGALYIDPELRVTTSTQSFFIHLRPSRPKIPEKPAFCSSNKNQISERLKVPEEAPVTTRTRSMARIETLHLCRSRFDCTARRNLGAILNPGGRLTVRPITALNLPDGYSGLVVKLRYGSEILVSETADARVTPRWAPPLENNGTSGSIVDFEFTRNDLHVHVEPQQTSGVMKLVVVADKLNNKAELGVLEIPLGAAIAACLNNQVDNDDIHQGTGPHIYVRWFPLMSPKLASPAEGDMGNSSRPVESEKLRDNMFNQYFTPCIQLAFMWWPQSETGQQESNEKDERAVSNSFTRRSFSSSKEVSPAVERYINADIARISIALIDSQRATELLSLTVMDLDARYSVTKTKTRTGLTVEWIQLDHQDPRAREPVVLSPTPTDLMQPTLQFLALKDNLRTKRNIASYEYIGVALREMDLTVEESWLFELWDFFMGVKRRRTVKRRTELGQKTANFLLTTDNCFSQREEDDSEVQPLLPLLEAEAGGGPKAKLYIEQLILGLVKVNLSYIKGKKQSFEMSDIGAKALKPGEVSTLTQTGSGILPENLQRGDQSEVFLKWSQHTHDEELIGNGGGYNLPGIIAAVFPSVSDASIRLQGKVIDHVFESSGEIASSIKTFYTNETLKQVYKIIGSLDFVGNPTILFSSFVSGVRDLVAAPTSAFLKSPTNVNQVGIAVGMGTLSFFSHSASGIFGFAAKMSATAGQAAAVLSLDKEFSQWHRDNVVSEATNLNRVWKQRGIQSLPEMLTRPLGDVILGVAMGASGLVISPYKGFKKGGGPGFVRGIAIGTAGLVAKPLVGVLDAFTHFSATAHDVAKSVNVLERRYQPALKLRLPYTFGPMNILSPFDPVSARSVYLLRAFPVKRKHMKHQKYAKEILVHAEVLHMEPGVDTFAIATTIRIALIRLTKDSNGNLLPSMCWEVFHGDDAKVASRISDHGHNGVALTVTRRVAVDKIEDIKGSKFRRPKVASEALNTPTFSSALSVESRCSDVEDEETTGIDESYHQFRESQRQEYVENNELQGNEPDPTFDHGATKKGDEVVKWYTVLAEYQHRPQLTRLHNAISSLVGGFDAIIRDRSFEGQGEREGVTTFGVFSFEKPIVGQLSIAASNAALIESLEALPWMHGHVFERIERLPKAKQSEAVLAVRRSWTFATDLECSKMEGGPAWLVEERALATFSSLETDYKFLSDSLNPGDALAGRLMERDERANRAAKKSHGVSPFSAHWADSEEETSYSDDSLPVKALDMNENNQHIRGHKKQHLSQQISAEAPRGFREHVPIDIDGDLFHSITIQESSLNQMGSVSFTSSEDSTNAKHLELENHISVENSSPTAAAATLVAASSQGPSADADRDESRIDRMESLMEKLVAINAQQLHKQPVPLETTGDSHSEADSRLADTLKQEVAELRSQVQARVVEDDALRKEINLLRQQLADRRDLRNAAREDRFTRIKIPDMLRFGGKKGEDMDEADVRQSPDGVPHRVYEAPLKDSPEEPSRNRLATPAIRGVGMPKPARRFSADSSAPIPVALLEAQTAARGNRPGRRPSIDSSLGVTVSRRASIGSVESLGVTPTRRTSIGSGVTRPSGRRMSGDHQQVRWE